MFWFAALKLLDEQSGVIGLGYECGAKGFDDIELEYAPGQAFARGHLQCKWHSRLGEFAYADLCAPRYSNATTYSLLQRAFAAYQAARQTGAGAIHCTLVTTDSIAKNDPLQKLYQKPDGSLRITGSDGLSSGKTERSAMGKMRKDWCEHLQTTEATMLAFAASLRFKFITEDMEQQRESLNVLLRGAGFAGVPAASSVFTFDHLPSSWMIKGEHRYTRAELLALCKQENLFATALPPAFTLAIKSFAHPIHALDETCASSLDFTSYFSGRHIKDAQNWQGAILPQLDEFLRKAAREQQRLRLSLDLHASLAFAAGAILNVKCGCTLELLQRSQAPGSAVWSLAGSGAPQPGWHFKVEAMEGAADQLAVVAALTHNAVADAKAFLAKQPQQVGNLLIATLDTAIGQGSVRDGEHACQLASSLATQINSFRGISQTHLFLCGPNGFVFCLGQMREGIGNVVLYEFDFGGTKEYGRVFSL